MTAFRHVQIRRAAIATVCWCSALITYVNESYSAPAPPTAQSLCAAMNSQMFSTPDGAVTISDAHIVTASAAGPEYCEVLGSIPPALHFEVRLPTQWNQRVLYVGGGGFDGVIPKAAGYEFAQGYATVASDGGHTAGSDESWALDPEKLNDY